jgi:hypothetical protein
MVPPTNVEGNMDTLIDIGILLSVYGSLSLFCAAMMRVLWALPHRSTYEATTTRGW